MKTGSNQAGFMPSAEAPTLRTQTNNLNFPCSQWRERSCLQMLSMSWSGALGIIPALEKGELLHPGLSEVMQGFCGNTICTSLYLTGYSVCRPWLQLSCLRAHLTGSNSQSRAVSRRSHREQILLVLAGAWCGDPPGNDVGWSSKCLIDNMNEVFCQ